MEPKADMTPSKSDREAAEEYAPEGWTLKSGGFLENCCYLDKREAFLAGIQHERSRHVAEMDMLVCALQNIAMPAKSWSKETLAGLARATLKALDGGKND